MGSLTVSPLIPYDLASFLLAFQYVSFSCGRFALYEQSDALWSYGKGLKSTILILSLPNIDSLPPSLSLSLSLLSTMLILCFPLHTLQRYTVGFTTLWSGLSYAFSKTAIRRLR